MALCLATSLLACEGFNADDQMQRYCRWRDEGYLSSDGRCFDIGNTINSALRRYQAEGNPYAGATDTWSAGNGSLMRLAPIPLFYFSEPEQIEQYAAESSRTTHGATECLDACRLLSRQLLRALSGEEKEQVLSAEGAAFQGTLKIQKIARGDYRIKNENAIHGTGYVVDCLEAALWCFCTTDNFEAAILKAANLGDDADTTAAVCGQLAGAYYGLSGIPSHWLARLVQREMIQELVDRLYQQQQAVQPCVA